MATRSCKINFINNTPFRLIRREMNVEDGSFDIEPPGIIEPNKDPANPVTVEWRITDDAKPMAGVKGSVKYYIEDTLPDYSLQLSKDQQPVNGTAGLLNIDFESRWAEHSSWSGRFEADAGALRSIDPTPFYNFSEYLAPTNDYSRPASDAEDIITFPFSIGGLRNTLPNAIYWVRLGMIAQVNEPYVTDFKLPPAPETKRLLVKQTPPPAWVGKWKNKDLRLNIDYAQAPGTPLYNVRLVNGSRKALQDAHNVVISKFLSVPYTKDVRPLVIDAPIIMVPIGKPSGSNTGAQATATIPGIQVIKNTDPFSAKSGLLGPMYDCLEVSKQVVLFLHATVDARDRTKVYGYQVQYVEWDENGKLKYNLLFDPYQEIR